MKSADLQPTFALLCAIGLLGCGPAEKQTQPKPPDGRQTQATDEQKQAADQQEQATDKQAQASGQQQQAIDAHEPVTGQDVKTEVKQAAEATGEFAAQKREEYLREMEAQLVELNRRISDMKDRAAALAGDTKQKWEQSLADLKQKRETFEKQYDQIADSSGQAWNDLKEGTDAAWDDLTQAVDEAARHFEDTPAEKTP